MAATRRVISSPTAAAACWRAVSTATSCAAGVGREGSSGGSVCSMSTMTIDRASKPRSNTTRRAKLLTRRPVPASSTSTTVTSAAASRARGFENPVAAAAAPPARRSPSTTLRRENNKAGTSAAAHVARRTAAKANSRAGMPIPDSFNRGIDGLMAVNARHNKNELYS